MKTALAGIVTLAAICAGLGTAAADDKAPNTGRLEFEEKCAVCHGMDGKGRGTLAEFLKKAPTDLTALSRSNGGVFPYMHVEAMIDGREIIKLHGDRNMPVWGRDYLKDEDWAKRRFADHHLDAELYARLRILALIDHLHQIQVK